MSSNEVDETGAHYTQRSKSERKTVSVRWNHFEERQIPKQTHSFINIA